MPPKAVQRGVVTRAKYDRTKRKHQIVKLINYVLKRRLLEYRTTLKEIKNRIEERSTIEEILSHSGRVCAALSRWEIGGRVMESPASGGSECQPLLVALADAPAPAHGLGQPQQLQPPQPRPVAADSDDGAPGVHVPQVPAQPQQPQPPRPHPVAADSDDGAPGVHVPQVPARPQQPQPPQPHPVAADTDDDSVPGVHVPQVPLYVVNGFANEYGWPADRPWDHPSFRLHEPVGPLGPQVWQTFHGSHVKRSYRSVGMCIMCGYYVESGPFAAPKKVVQPCQGFRTAKGRSNLVRLQKGAHPRWSNDFLL